MARTGPILRRLATLAFALSAPFALYIDDLFAAQPRLVSVTSPLVGKGTGQPTISGRATAIEGDLIEVAGKPVRLYGIDAPEIAQSCRVMIFAWGCGIDSQKMLNALIAEREVTCVEVARERNGVPVALCQTDGVQLNETMVRIGMAVAAPGEPRRFASDEAAAEREGVGVWRSNFEMPWDWRATNAAK